MTETSRKELKMSDSYSGRNRPFNVPDMTFMSNVTKFVAKDLFHWGAVFGTLVFVLTINIVSSYSDCITQLHNL